MVRGRAIFLYVTSTFYVYTSVTCQQVRQWRYSETGDVELTDYLSFECRARSLLQCGQECSQRLSCLSFTFTKSNVTSGRCRGHSTFVTSQNLGVTSPRTTLYHRVIPPWLNQICNGNGECPVPDSECFEGKCLCTPGYYYSVSTQLCVKDCAESDLQTTFVEYPRHYIYGGNTLGLSRGNTTQGCRDWCAATADCRTCELRGDVDNQCNLDILTPLDVPSSQWIDSRDDRVTFWQKMCK